MRELTYDERATFGECPVCHVTDGKWCHAEVGVQFGFPINGGRMETGDGAHLGRLQAAPMTIAESPVEYRRGYADAMRQASAELAELRAKVEVMDETAASLELAGAAVEVTTHDTLATPTFVSAEQGSLSNLDGARD